MTKIIEIEYCGQCPHFGTDKDVAPACKLKDIKNLGRKLPRNYTIPNWCPLLDKINI